MCRAFGDCLLRYLLILFLLFAPLVGHADGPRWTTAPDVIDVVASQRKPLPNVPDDWVQHDASYASVHASPDDSRVALHLSRAAAMSLPRLSRELGLPIGGQIHIYLAPDRTWFAEEQPGHPPEWADGTAWPHQGTIFLYSPRARPGTAAPLDQVLDHELTHVLLGRAFGQRVVPRWLQEGVAQLAAREYSPEKVARMGQGLFADDLFSINDLAGGFPADPIRAQLAYAQSADLIAFIHNRHGPDALPTLIEQMVKGETVGMSVRAATGVGIDELNTAWHAELHSSPLWLKTLVSDTAILGAAGIVFLFLGFFALRRRKARMQAMAIQEELDQLWQDPLAEMWQSAHPNQPQQPPVLILPEQLSEYGPH